MLGKGVLVFLGLAACGSLGAASLILWGNFINYLRNSRGLP